MPDGALRTIPMAALHDGKQFLIAKYAVGITPSLSLSDPRPIKRENMKVLAVGVTEAVQGFPALPNVAAELEAMQTLLGSENLVDRQFLASNLEKKLKEEQFSIVHVASMASSAMRSIKPFCSLLMTSFRWIVLIRWSECSDSAMIRWSYLL